MERYIEDCLYSIINQVEVFVDDFEIIVVNDGSIDNTKKVVEDFITKNKKYNIILINKENEGVSIARNIGLYSAKGDYVWFIDPDDCISNDALKYIIEAVKNYNVHVIRIGNTINNIMQSDGCLIYHTKTERIPSLYRIIPAYEIFNKKYEFGHTTFIWNRRFLIDNNLHYPEYIAQNEDFFFLMKALYKADKLYINNTYQFYYIRNGIESASRIKNRFDRIDKFMKNRLILLNGLFKMNQCFKEGNTQRDKLFHKKYIEYQAEATVRLMISGAPNYFIRYYLKELSQLGCYPLTKEMMETLKYYFPIFNNKMIFYIVSVIYRFDIMCFLEKKIKKIINRLKNKTCSIG